MRLFVAIDVSDATRAQLRNVRAALEESLQRARPAPRLTWVASEAAHVTLRFIGEVTDAVAERVGAALCMPFTQSPYELEFRGVGAFPNSRRPRVIWIGAERGQTETAALVQLVNGRLDPLLGVTEARPFRAHLSVARVKEPVSVDWEAAFARVNIAPTLSAIDHVTLYQSRTAPSGPTYTPICSVPLSTELKVRG